VDLPRKIHTAVLLCSLFIVTNNVFSQKNDDLQYAVDSIASWLNQISVSNDDSEKIRINNYVISYMDMVLHDDASFEMNFDSVKYLKVLDTDSKKLRIYTWNIFYEDGSFTYFGYLQYKKNKELFTYQLLDCSDDTVGNKRSFTSYKEWYGALYYEVVEKKWNNKEQYVLIGWDGADRLINRKIVESLSFSRSGLPVFGEKVFVVGKEKKGKLFYEYSEMATMILRYNQQNDIIVIDHLAPSNSRFTGHYQYYGPDFSYDALEYNSGKWYFKPDIDPNKAINYEKNKRIDRLQRRGASKNF